MTAQFQADLSEYYLDRPTGTQLDALRAARLPALADPLEKGVVLDWAGPNLYPDTLPPREYPLNDYPEPTPNPPRPLLHPLLALNSPSHGAPGWSLRLLEALREGSDRWSQVWRCEASYNRGDQGEPVGTVVLKLRQQSLFPEPADRPSVPATDSWNWYPAAHLAKREAHAYSVLRPYQGRDIPLCYGFYFFHLPSGERVVAAVLEDLSETTRRLSQHLHREVAGRRLNIDTALPLAVSAFRLQYRLQSQGLIDLCHHPSDFLLLRDGSSPPSLIALSFGRCRILDIVLNAPPLEGPDEMTSFLESDSEDEEPDEDFWRVGDQMGLNAAFYRALEPVGVFSVHQHRSHLPFLK
ncbi:hypothetical protein JCM8097_004812 [Rhodosporidiobolus ruineniae]